MSIEPAAVAQLIAHHPLTERIVETRNPELTWAELADGLAEIVYPVA